jgi:hypothetical protein
MSQESLIGNLPAAMNVRRRNRGMPESNTQLM